MPKILVLGSHAESLIIFRYDFLKELSKHNEVIAASPCAKTAEITQDCISKLKQINVRFCEVKLSRTGLNPFYDLLTIYNLYKLFRQERPDKIFAYTSKPVIFGSLAAKLAGVAQIYSMITGLGSYFIHQDLKSRIVRFIMSSLYKIALMLNTKVFFQNTDDIADFAKHRIFQDPKRTVITNGSGVNLQHFSQLPLPVENICFLLTARLIQAKGVVEYLQAASLIKRQYSQVEFLLVGWYEDKSETIDKDFIQQYVDNNVITFLGKLDDVRIALAKTSVFVLPSYREGTPKTVLEAMACGRAIIATNVPGCRETVVDGQNGWLVPARDVTSLHDAMEKFIINPALIVNMGRCSRKMVTAKYNVDEVNQVICTAMEN